jgi:putative hydrolase
MKFYGDYHTHTRYSDAVGTVRQSAEAAIKRGLVELGISDHGYNNASLSLTRKKAIKQRVEINSIRREFPTLKIYRSIEADLIGLDGTIDMDIEEFYDYDYIIAGFHRWAVAKGIKDFFGIYYPAYMTTFRAPKEKEIVHNTDSTIKMLERYPIAIFPHMNSGTHVDPVAVATACADLGVFVELNVKHLERNLGHENFEKVLTTNARFIASSDAHNPERIGNLDKIIDFVSQYGIEDRIVNTGNSTPNFRTIKNTLR